MHFSTLVRRNLTYFWRTNLAVVLGFATAVAVLAGALLVGDSVRASLRELFIGRIGATDFAVTSTGFFRQKLGDDLASKTEFDEAVGGYCPLIALSGLVIDEQSGHRASSVQLYGVDDSFWRFNSVEGFTVGDRDIILSPDLVSELGSAAGRTILLRVEKPSAIPAGSLHGRKEDLSRTIRLTQQNGPSRTSLLSFSLRPQQGPTRSAFVSIARLQKDLDLAGKSNLLLLSRKAGGSSRKVDRYLRSLIEKELGETFSLEDLGIKLRPLDQKRGVALESDSAFVSDSIYQSARAAGDGISGISVRPILSYLANSIKLGDREIPYSIVSSLNSEEMEVTTHDYGHGQGPTGRSLSEEDLKLPPIVLNEWASNDLGARREDVVTLEYYQWQDEGRLETEKARFRVEGIVPMTEEFLDRDLVPDYPGITESQNIGDWDPPFPVDLQRVRPRDEDYWHKYKTAPKAFVPLELTEKLWSTRFGKYTSLRIVDTRRAPQEYLEEFRKALREKLDPFVAGLAVNSVRSEGDQASRGATDFGEYFVYFSFFLVIAALLLATVFFRVGIEQRLREIGLLRAVGYNTADVRSLFLREGVLLGGLGGAIGIVGAVGYGALIMYGLRTWWVGAVGTTLLTLKIQPLSMLLGIFSGVGAAFLCIVWTIRSLAQASPREMLAGNLEAAFRKRPGTASRFSRVGSPSTLGILLLLVGGGLLLGSVTGRIGDTGGFFGGGMSLLAALLCFEYAWLKRPQKNVIHGHGWWPVVRLGFRNAAHRPGRSALCIALIASAAFIIVAVDSFRRDDRAGELDRRSGTGGYPLAAESLLPLYHDPNTPDGREALNLFERPGLDLSKLTFMRFRVRKGDDASCLNLYQPRDPRILAPEDDFIKGGRFSFQTTEAQDVEERTNPWLMLNRNYGEGIVPVVADANSLTYVLHHKVGDEIELAAKSGPVKLRVVGALADSIFQGELLMSERNFLRLFPDIGGYSFFLIDAPGENWGSVSAALEDELSEFGFDVVSASEKLASFHKVENTYISTFQALGGLGLVLGTIGLGAVLLRNVLERRRELALLRAVGYNQSHLAWMVIAENAFLVSCGLAIGMICAIVAILPAIGSRGGHLPVVSLPLLALVLVVGLTASVAATMASLRAPLIPALRAE